MRIEDKVYLVFIHMPQVMLTCVLIGVYLFRSIYYLDANPWSVAQGLALKKKQLQVQTPRAAETEPAAGPADALPLDPKPSAQASDTGAQGGPSGVKS